MMGLALIPVILLGVFSGTIAGTLGVGGGVIIVPALALGLGIDQQVAQGTSLMVIIPTAVIGTYANARQGLIVWREVLALSIGGVVGVLGGTTAALSLTGDALRLVFAAYMGIAGARLLWTTRRIPKVGQGEVGDQRTE